MVLSALANKVTNKFKGFCKTELMDRFLHSCIEYFQASAQAQRPTSGGRSATMSLTARLPTCRRSLT